MEAPTPTDAATLIESLDPEAIRYQLAELDRQRAALRTLLRAALARERVAARRAPRPAAPEGGAHG